MLRQAGKVNVDALVNVAITVAGVGTVRHHAHRRLFRHDALKSITLFMLTYGAIIYLPIMTFISRKADQITKTIWVEAL